MSRRDEAVETLSGLATQLLSTVLRPPLAAANSRPSTAGLSQRITTLLDRVIDVPAPAAPPANPGPQTLARVPEPSPAPPASGDELPAYSRRAARSVTVGTVPTKVHSYETKSKKLRLDMVAPGESAIVLIGTSQVDGEVILRGELKLRLASPEPVTHLRIRLKGLVRTLVLKIASGRHPVAEEVIFWEDAVDLWSESSGPPLASTSSDPSKLQGEFTFPFQLKLPAQITRVSAQGASRKYSLPPSFVLSSDEGLGSGEWASTRYFVKVTLRRRGLLKANDRLIVPVMFLPRHKAPVGSVERTAAQREGRPVPGPTEDPAGWGGRLVEQSVKRGVFTGRKATYTVNLSVPTVKITRLTALPFYITLTSTDPSTTSYFPMSALKVLLVMRCFVQAQGHTGTHDSIVARGTITTAEEPVEMRTGNGWSKTYRGEILLGSNVGCTFRAPNLIVTFLAVARVECPGPGNDCEVLVPIEVVSPFLIPPVAPAADNTLPPSYFEVTED